MGKLSEAEVASKTGSVPDWKRAGAEISRTFQFKDFAGAMKFVNAVAAKAENANHHPDIDIRWNKVKLVLSTHSEGGLTEKDFALAKICDQLA
jgi:4a-hydroxytetrahydrobiopterin dehydratase